MEARLFTVVQPRLLPSAGGGVEQTEQRQDWMRERAELLAQRDELLRDNAALRVRLARLNEAVVRFSKIAGQPASELVATQMRSGRNF